LPDTENQESCNEERRYNVYIEQHKGLVEIQLEGSKRFDHWICTFSGGLIALSITFLDKIAPAPKPESIWELKLSWLCCIVTIVASLASHLTSMKAMDRQMDIIKDQYLSPNSQIDDSNSWSRWTASLNSLSICTFFAALIFICLFSYANISNKSMDSIDIGKNNLSTVQEGKKMSRDEKISVSKGAVVPRPMSLDTPQSTSETRMGAITPKAVALPVTGSQGSASQPSTTSQSSGDKE
jgi:hypothetical protein